MSWDGEWCEAPPVVTGPTLWRRRLEPLRSEPGRWARFGGYGLFTTGKQVARINSGAYGEGFTARRASENGQDWIYVCFEEEMKW